MSFWTNVNAQAAPAVEGDFCDANPRSTVDFAEGAAVAGVDGVRVARFVWADEDNRTVRNTGQGIPTGFIHRNQQGVIFDMERGDTLSIYPGAFVTVHNEGGFWVKNNGALTSQINYKAYADYGDGSISFNVTGAPPTGASCSAGTVDKIVSANTGGALPSSNTSTGSISGTTLTVSAVGAGSVLGVGQTISGGNVNSGIIDPHTTIMEQLGGTKGGVGTYRVSISQSVTSTTITMSGGGLTLTGSNQSGIFAIGHVISGTNIPAGTVITGYGTGTGGAGTYTVSQKAVTPATASTITVTNAMFLTVDGTSTGTWRLNDKVDGVGISGSFIKATKAENAALTGAGGAGTYLVTGYYDAVTSQTISVLSGVETKWIAQSVGSSGELVKMTSQHLG